MPPTFTPRPTLKKRPKPSIDNGDDDDLIDVPAAKVRKSAVQARRTPSASQRRDERLQNAPAPAVESNKLFSTAVVATRSEAITPREELSDDERQLATVFGASAANILEQLEIGNTDGAMAAIQKALLKSIVTLLPSAESYVRDSKGARGVHGYNLLVGQMRELLADLQALRDRGALGQSIVERHLRPAYLDLGVQLQLALTRIDAEATARMQDRADVQEFRKEVSKIRDSLSLFMTTQYGEVSDIISRSLT